MNFPDRTPAWRRYLRFVRRDVQADVDDELHFHFESRIAELVAAGATPEAARAQTAAEFGDVTAVRRDLHTIGDRISSRERRAESLHGWWQDIRYAARALRRTPTTSLAIILTLTLGIGMDAVMFSLLNVLYFRPPAVVQRPNELRRVWIEITTSAQKERPARPAISYPQYEAMVGAARDAQMALYSFDYRNRVQSKDWKADVNVGRVSRSFFDVLGVHAAFGRLFTTTEGRFGGGAHLANLSDAFWRSHFDADSSVLGRTIRVNGVPYTVIGVMPKHFTGIDIDAVDLWAPLATSHEGWKDDGLPWWQSARLISFRAILRIQPGTNETRLNEQLTTGARVMERMLGLRDSLRATMGPIIETRGPGEATKEQTIAVRLGAVAVIVLLIACANVVNLLLARAAERRQEISIRLALGASRRRLVRLVLVESLLLAIIAAGAAGLCANWGGVVLRKVLLPDVHWAAGPLQASVIVFTLVVALITGTVTGLIPAWQSTGTDLTAALKSGSRTRSSHRVWIRSALVIAQASLSVVLLVGAALFIRSMTNVQALDIGYDVNHVIVAYPQFEPSQSLPRAEMASRMRALASRLKDVSGVQSVALAQNTPMYGASFAPFFTETDSAHDSFFPSHNFVSPGYFATVGLRVVRGGDFSPPRGVATARETVMNDAMASTLWPDRNPVGQCMHFETRTSPCYTVVGVVENGRENQILEDAKPMYYLPIDVLPPQKDVAYQVVMRVHGDGNAAVAAARTVIQSSFPGATAGFRRLSKQLEPQYRPWRLGATLFTACGLLALVVALLGIYSTVSYTVSQRSHEFGIRLALGAQGSDVLRLVLLQSTRTVVIGALIGVVLALISGRFIASLLYGVKPSDPLSIAAVAGALIVIAVVAALTPAWRASRVDPVTSLRAE